MVKNYCVVKIFVITLSFCSTNGFNLSPIPSYIIKEPKVKISVVQSKSSYFGFTINLRKSSIIVGAPRAQSTLEKQLDISEPGAIYSCKISNSSCTPLIFDNTGSIAKPISYQTLKSYQWLGASMDGGPSDSDKIVVCAPRLLTNTSSEYLLNGICYIGLNNLTNGSLTVSEIAPFNLKCENAKGNQLRDDNALCNLFNEQGLSAHITSNNEEIIIGAPGVHGWRGSIIRQNVSKIDNFPDFPEPQQKYGSYFGFSVGSGYFDSDLPKKMLYVASAPKAFRESSGEVYIFDIISEAEKSSIKKFKVFNSSQFGEYFGYAVLAEDLNGDGLSDLIVSAPHYSSHDHFERGAIYVFINKGNFLFEQMIIRSPEVQGNGRFGTTISRLGDINRDGFNDIAVGVPFSGKGSVFIYLGYSKGLREEPSQKINAAPSAISSWGQHVMFGHGLSKGCDIDDNGFNDFAIGAPNAEMVFVYRAYPVVKIHATINSTRGREIKPTEKSLHIDVCFRISTRSTKVISQKITMHMKLDPKIKRLTFNNTLSTKATFFKTITKEQSCRGFDIDVRNKMAYIFKPIELKLHYALTKKVQCLEEFCDDCAVVDPRDRKFVVENIKFASECKSTICVVDLKVTSCGIGRTYTLGSSQTISVTYEITNSGEQAYMPQINITSSNKMPFYKIPPSCQNEFDYLICDLSKEKSMSTNSKENITIVYVTSQMNSTLKSMKLTAFVFSAGKELKPSDNIKWDFITFEEFTNIEVIGTPNTTDIDLEKYFNSTAEIINKYEIQSIGPSTIQEVKISIDIPIAHKFHNSTQLIDVIDIGSISVEGVYNNEQLLVDFYQNKTLLVLNSTDIESYTKGTLVEIGEVSKELKNPKERSPRNTDKMAPNNDHIDEQMAPNNDAVQKNDSVVTKRKLVFSCVDPEIVTCVTAVIKVNHLIPYTPATITLRYHVDLIEVNKTLIKPWEFFEIVPSLMIVKVGDMNGSTINITTNMKYIQIFKHHLYVKNQVTPWWLICLGIFGGLLVLAGIACGMQKAGFFKRITKEEMQRIYEEQQEVAKFRADIISELAQKRHLSEDNENGA